MADDKDMDYNLEMEEEFLETPKWPKTAKFSLSFFIGLSIILAVGVVTLAIFYDKKSNEPGDNEGKSNIPVCLNISKIPNLPYDEDGKIINSFKKQGENYIENLEEINNGSDYNKNERNYYDLYIPETAENRKNETNGIFLWIHGGGWIEGSKESMEGFCQLTAAQGYISATLSYTLLIQNFTDYNIFKIIDEITSCIKAIKKYLKQRGFDENKLKLAIGGYSAGAHLTLLYSYLIKKLDIIPVSFLIDMAGPIALEKKYFLKIASVEDSLEDIKDIESIEKVNKEGKLIPIFNEWYLILLSNRFYGHKYTEQELKEMIDEKGNIIKNNEKYQKMYNVIKYAFITEIEDLHNNLETLCFYGGLDEAVGVTVFANLKKKADKDGRKLELIYSRYATHSNLISPAYYKLPSNFNVLEKFNELGSGILKYAKKHFGY